eukprot:UN21615
MNSIFASFKKLQKYAINFSNLKSSKNMHFSGVEKLKNYGDIFCKLKKTQKLWR